MARSPKELLKDADQINECWRNLCDAFADKNDELKATVSEQEELIRLLTERIQIERGNLVTFDPTKNISVEGLRALAHDLKSEDEITLIQARIVSARFLKNLAEWKENS